MKNLIIIFVIIVFMNNICIAFGTKWTEVFQNDSLDFLAIDSPDSSYCMALASLRSPFNAILKSTDAGETWKLIYRDTVDLVNRGWPKYAQDLVYPTRDLCIVSLDSSSFLKTTDGGKTWEQYKVDIPYTMFGFRDVDMYDENNGIMASNYYFIITHDGFKTWDTIPSPEGNLIFCAAMPGPHTICIVTRHLISSTEYEVKYYRSQDDGMTLTEYPHPNYDLPMQLQFVDSLVGYEVGGSSTGKGNQKYELVYKTTNGGYSWINVLDTIIYRSFGLQKLDFYDKDNGIVVGQFGSIFWTHDGGKSWIYDSSIEIWNEKPATMNVCYIRPDRAIIADFNGYIYTSSEITGIVNYFSTKNDFLMYPNPFSSSFNIEFTNSTVSAVSIDLYDILGNKIYTKELGSIDAGKHQSSINPGSGLSPGFYIVAVRCGSDVKFLKVVKGD